MTNVIGTIIALCIGFAWYHAMLALMGAIMPRKNARHRMTMAFVASLLTFGLAVFGIGAIRG